MLPRFLIRLTGRDLPVIQQPEAREPMRSTVTDKTVAAFTRVVEQTGILKSSRETD